MGKYDQELIETAQKLSTPGKGILAADESTGTIGKRFAPISVENNQDNRRRYRQLLFETPDLNKYISGVITFEETLFEKKTDGTPFVDLLNEQNIVIGIKVDKGQKPLTEYGETATQGIDGLGDRCAEYYKAGARFAKWRAVLKIDDKNCPSQLCIDEQTRGLARYAQICQENGLVPIVEPEILMDGDHTLEKSAQVFERVWYSQIKHLSEYGVLFEGILLKPNFVRCGVECSTQSSMEEIASYTLRSLQRTIPSAIPGINFLSGGMSETQATETLNILNSIAGKKPWSLSFSYGRALQATVLQKWKGEDSNIEAAQAALMVRAKANGMAQLGKYAGEEGDGEASKSLHQKNYTY